MKKSLCAVLFVSVVFGFVGNGWCGGYDPDTPFMSWDESFFLEYPTQKEIFLSDTLTFSGYAIGGWLNGGAQRIPQDEAPLNPTDLIMEVYEYDGTSPVGEPLYFFQGIYHPDEHKWTVEGSFPVEGLPKQFIVIKLPFLLFEYTKSRKLIYHRGLDQLQNSAVCLQNWAIFGVYFPGGEPVLEA
jgi:hypothetical protein